MYGFFAKLMYNEYIRPYLLSHVVFTIFTSGPPRKGFMHIVNTHLMVVRIVQHIAQGLHCSSTINIHKSAQKGYYLE